jgi:CheY-like chemotaxis protein
LEPVSLAPVLDEALGLVRPLAQQHGVTLHGGPWPGDAFVHADRQRLVQVLLNLLSNAIKYNQVSGTVRLQASLTADRRCAIRVIDTGRGVPANRLDELFTPFARLGAEQSDVEGTGLGLALSRRLCEAMNGSLTLDSSSSQGSVFLIALDAAESPLRVFESGAHFPAVTAAYRETSLLYIEDNLANLSLVETILFARPGWRVLPALQGQLGVELAREHRPEVILLDLHLPDIPGAEVLRRLRADARTADLPIVIVSADATPSSVERLRVMGADAYLTKPIDVDEFLRVVDRLVQSRGAQS